MRLIPAYAFDLKPHFWVQVNDNFLDKEFFEQVINCFAAISGFVTRKASDRVFECSRGGKGPAVSADQRKFASGDLKCGCEFKLSCKPCCHYANVEKQKNGSVKKVYRPYFDRGYYVTVSKAMLEHTGGCKPGALQHVMQKSRSGNYVSDISQLALFTLCGSSQKRMVDSMVCMYLFEQMYYFVSSFV